MSKKDDQHALVSDDTPESSPGEMLASQRNKLGISEADIAESLKISVSRLKSIEADDYKKLPSETYIRGYLRNYARLVDIDEQALMQAYECIRRQGDPASSGSEMTINRQQNQNNAWWAYILVVILISLGIVAYWLFGDDEKRSAFVMSYSDAVESLEAARALSSSADATVPELEEAASPANVNASQGPAALSTGENRVLLDESAPLTNEEPENEVATDSSLEASSITETELPVDVSTDTSAQELALPGQVTAAELVRAIEANEAAESETAEATVVTAPPAVKGDRLVFNFDNPCWIKVTDAQGRVIASGLQPAASELTVSGKAPFRVVVGNVEGTTLMYNGSPVELVVAAGRKLAKLRVGG